MAKSRSKKSRQAVKKSPRVRRQSPARGKWVYAFGGGKAEGRAAMRNLLGGKGAGLAEMAHLGLPVPPGFTITTEVCTYFYDNGKTYPKDSEGAGRGRARRGRPHRRKEIRRWRKSAAGLGALGRARVDAGHDGHRAQSRPQRRDGEALAEKSGDRRFAYDSYRRFITMYSDVVLGIGHHHFEEILDEHKDRNGYTLDTDLDAGDWAEIIARYKERVEEESGKPFPQDPHAQLWGAIGAVFGSWMNQRAITYRRLHAIPESWGTAVNVQAMVFGNMGETSATGVAFTRNPSTGEKKLYGEFLINAQGEDVVAGIRTPQEITEAGAQGSRLRQAVDGSGAAGSLRRAQAHPRRAGEALPRHAGPRIHGRAGQAVDAADAQRQAHRAGRAAHRRRAGEGEAHHQEEAVARIDPAALDQLLHPTIDPNAERKVIATGLPASPGAACGEIVFSSEDAETLKSQGRKVILVRVETSPEDIHGMHAAEGILTTRGGMTSHAAVVARGMGKPCVSGAGALRVDYRAQTMTAGGTTHEEGRYPHHRRLDRPGAGRHACRCRSRRWPANSPR